MAAQQQQAELDAQEQADEAASLQAIFGEECVQVQPDARSLTVRLTGGHRRSASGADAEQAVVVRVLLPADYPSASPPLVELHAPLSAQQHAQAVQHMEGLFTPGQVCLFDCIEWLRERLQQWQDEAAAAAAEAAALAAALEQQAQLGSGQRDDADDSSSSSTSSRHGSDDLEDWHTDPSLLQAPESGDKPRQRAQPAPGSGRVSDDDASLMQQMAPRIVSGEPFTERKSTFQAHVAPVSSVAQVRAVVAVLLQNNKIRHATHNIMAYRISVPQRPGVLLQDCDDDGEAAAGGRLLHLLQVADVQGAVVVVSRWFGGILLGPARFGLINNTARQLLEQTGFIASGGGGSGGTTAGGVAKSKKPSKHRH